MSDATVETTPETTAPVEAAPQALETPKPTPPAAADKTFTQDQVNNIVRERLEADRTARARSTDTTADDRLAALEAKLATAETAAVNAIVAKAAVGTHDPAAVARLVDLGELTSGDAAAIEAKVAEFLTANPYLVKATAGPDLTPSPGVGNTGAQDKALLTADELEQVTAAQLAADDKLADLYARSRAALRR